MKWRRPFWLGSRFWIVARSCGVIRIVPVVTARRRRHNADRASRIGHFSKLLIAPRNVLRLEVWIWARKPFWRVWCRWRGHRMTWGLVMTSSKTSHTWKRWELHELGTMASDWVERNFSVRLLVGRVLGRETIVRVRSRWRNLLYDFVKRTWDGL